MQREYKISLSQEYYSDVIYLSQYDSDYNIVFNVIDKYSAASVDGYAAKFTGLRNDGLGFTFESTGSGTTVTFTIDTTLTAVSGTQTGEIIFYDDNGLYFGSANVQIIVEPAAQPDGTIDADTQTAQTIQQEVQEIVDTAAATVTASVTELEGEVDTNAANISTNTTAIGTLSNLTTDAQTNLVSAINEVDAHADTNADAISSLNAELNENITSIKSALGTQLSFSVTENAYINTTTGDAATLNNNIATDFIPVIAGYSYTIVNAYLLGSRGICFYDTDQAYLSSASVDHEVTTTQTVTVTAPVDAHYMRVTGYTGYALSVSIATSVVEQIGTKVDKYQGVSESGNFLKIDALGNVTSEKVVFPQVTEEPTITASKADLTLKGYLSTSTGAYTDAPTSATQRCTDFIELNRYALYKLEGSAINSGQSVSGFRAVILYNADKSFSRRLASSDYPQFYLENNEQYIRINTNADEVLYMRLYPISEGYEGVRVLEKNLIVPQVDNVDTIPYIHARRATIGFIIDGEYDLNEDMHDVYAEHGAVCGYAVPYNTTYSNNPLAKYIQWQSEGFEMITHGNYAIPEETTTPDATVKQRIKDSYLRMEANGLHVKGYIGSSGAVAERFIPTIKNYYSWSATVANHGATAEPCIIYGTDRPYYLWRYSMQLATLEQQKSAVDRAIANGYLLLFYGHANSANTDYFTTENLDALLTYIESVGGRIMTPSKAIEEYFAIRYDDIYDLIQ